MAGLLCLGAAGTGCVLHVEEDDGLADYEDYEGDGPVALDTASDEGDEPVALDTASDDEAPDVDSAPVRDPLAAAAPSSAEEARRLEDARIAQDPIVWSGTAPLGGYGAGGYAAYAPPLVPGGPPGSVHYKSYIYTSPYGYGFGYPYGHYESYAVDYPRPFPNPFPGRINWVW